MTNAYEPPDADGILGYEAYVYGPERTGWAPGFIQSTLPDGVTRYISNGAEVSIPSENLGFYFGGIRGANWGLTTEQTRDWYPADTLIGVDMSTMRDEQWSNNTLPADISPRAGAELVWIPVGGQGALVAIGGMAAVESRLPAGLNSSQIEDAETEAPGYMTSLPVYDIVSKIWYIQNTTGEAPGPLTEFCSVVAQANDSSSFNVYIYGGYDGLNSTSIPSDDVWILSIPSFTWVKAYDGNSAHGRRGHQCERIYPDQMLVIGGVNPDSSSCIEGGPIQIFNLNTLKFQDVYDPKVWSQYAVPEIVTAVIGGTSRGGSTKTTTFSDDALSSLFGTPYTKSITRYFPYTPASGTPPGTTPSPSLIPAPSSGLADWVAPVLGVVLGLIVLSIIIVLILLYRRRKNASRNSGTGSQPGDTRISTNRIFNWVNGMSNQPTDSRKAEGSVTETDVESDNSMASPLVGFTEVAGVQRYEMAEMDNKNKNPIYEMPTIHNDPEQLNHRPTMNRDHPIRNIDFAWSSKASESQPSRSRRGSDSQPESHPGVGLGFVSSPSTIISPSSPSSPPSQGHLQSHSLDSVTGASNTASTAPSPYVQPHSPEDIGIGATTRSATNSPSPTESPNLNPTSPNTGTTGQEKERPSHHRNVSSLSSNIYQLPSPDGGLSPAEDYTSASSRDFRSGDGDRRLGALDAAIVSPVEEGVERKKTNATTGTNGKKSSFVEKLNEREK